MFHCLYIATSAKSSFTPLPPQDALPRTWRSIVTSASRHEFTLRHLLRRQFGSSEEAVREAVIGEHSFGGCLSAALTERPAVADVVVLPSEAKPCPGKLGYYTGGHTTREHCKRGRVDTLQVELPLSLRTAAQERMEAGTCALAAALLAFHRLHYSAQPQHRPSPAISRYNALAHFLTHVITVETWLATTEQEPLKAI